LGLDAPGDALYRFLQLNPQVMHLAEPANAAATAAGKPGRGTARFRWRQRSGGLVKRAQWLSIELPPRKANISGNLEMAPRKPGP